MARKPNRYQLLIAEIFRRNYRAGSSEVHFLREQLSEVARELGMKVPKNLGDILYTYRYRSDLPADILAKAPKGLTWIIMPAGSGKYCFKASESDEIKPDTLAAVIKIPDATPGIIERYALSDEQALLAKLRYNRLLDIFLGLTCYSLQNHLRTTVPGMGQVETDEMYVGIRRGGEHYVVPVQAKGGSDRLSVVQIAQDFALCGAKFPDLICLPVAAQFMPNQVIALFRFLQQDGTVKIADQKHYQLVPASELTTEDLKTYRQQTESES